MHERRSPFPMKAFLVCTLLLLLVPLSSLRLVCLDAHAESAAARPAADRDPGDPSSAEADDECRRVCMRRQAPPPPPQPTTTCALIPDPTCTYLASAVTAVMPREPVMPAVATVCRVESIVTDDYLPPVLPKDSPPPRG